MHGLTASMDSQSPPGGGIYDARANLATYERLQMLAEAGLTAGYSVIVDAAFLKKSQRDKLRDLAAGLHTPLVILDFAVPESELRRRIRQRIKAGGDVSEANEEVLNHQMIEQQPLDVNEQQFVITIDPDTAPAEVARCISGRFNYIWGHCKSP